MIDILGIIAIGVAAFAATDIDDLFVLMILFSSLNFPVRHIILGQYLGIGLLIVIGLVGSLISLVVPSYAIGLMGIVPIILGVKDLIEISRKNNSFSRQLVEDKRSKSYLSFLSVAAVTFSNGGDNISVYVPLFSKYNTMAQISGLIVAFMIMTAVWLAAAYYFANHPLIASRVRRIGNVVLPFVLIGLGIFILVESFVFA